MKQYIKRHRKSICFFTAILLFIMLFTGTIMAKVDEHDPMIISALQQFDMPQCNLITYPFRELGWLLIKGLAYLVNGIESIVYGINQVVGGFFTTPEVQALVNKILPIVAMLLIVVIAFIGFQFMIKKQNANVLLANFLVGLLVLIGLPYAITQMYAFTIASIDYLGVGNLSIGSEIVSDGVTDVLLYDDMFTSGQSPDSLNPTNRLNADTITTIDPTELIKPGDKNLNLSHPDYYSYYLSTDSDGNTVLKETKDGLFGIDFLSNEYYRWKIDWFGIIVTLAITALALVLSGIKIARLLFELVVHQIMAQAFAITDIYGGQRMKRCLQGIVSTFITLFGCFLLLQLYTIGSAYVSANAHNIFEKIIMLAALAFAVIDGPNIFESVIGIDAGLNRITGSILGTRFITGGVRTLKHGVTAAAKTTGNIIGKSASLAGVAGGIAGGKIAGNQAVKKGADMLSETNNMDKSSKNPNGSFGSQTEQEQASKTDTNLTGANNLYQQSGQSSTVSASKPNQKSPNTNTPNEADNKINNGGIYKQSSQSSTLSAAKPNQDSPNTGTPNEADHNINNGSIYKQSGQNANASSDTAANIKNESDTKIVEAGVYNQSNQSKNQKNAGLQNQTLGGYVKESVSNRVANIPAVSSTRRAYTLSKNSQILKKNKNMKNQTKGE